MDEKKIQEIKEAVRVTVESEMNSQVGLINAV